jgi:hypothetical protein
MERWQRDRVQVLRETIPRTGDADELLYLSRKLDSRYRAEQLKKEDMMKEIVIVYGPPMSGKTLNKEIIAEHFKCDAVFDGAEAHEVLKYPGRCLVLSDQPKVSGMEIHGAEIVHVDRAKELIGVTWQEAAFIHSLPNA